jgi:hypothetical protein
MELSVILKVQILYDLNINFQDSKNKFDWLKLYGAALTLKFR